MMVKNGQNMCERGKNGKGQTNAEYFGIDEEEYIEQDRKAKEAYEEKKKKKREEEIALGKKSQKRKLSALEKRLFERS